MLHSSDNDCNELCGFDYHGNAIVCSKTKKQEKKKDRDNTNNDKNKFGVIRKAIDMEIFYVLRDNATKNFRPKRSHPTFVNGEKC